MANHGYVIRYGKCSEERLDELIKEFCSDPRWNDLIVECEAGYWDITHPDHPGYIGIFIGEWFDYNEDTDEETEEPAIELRHGGARDDYIWWVDFSLQSFIADKLGGKISDDGTGGIHNPQPEKYPTFESFNKKMTSWWKAL